MDVNNRPWGYQFVDAGRWIDCAARNGASHHLVTLTIYIQRSRQFQAKVSYLNMECEPKRKAIQRAQFNVNERRDQIVAKRWGVGSLKKNRDHGGPVDQAYTVRKLAEAQEKLAMLQNDYVYDEKVRIRLKLSNHAEGLQMHIRSYFETGGLIRCWEEQFRKEAVVRNYPANKREAKRRIEDAQEELEAIRKRYKEAKADLGLDDSSE
jgi:hypothetical protein